MHSNRGLARRLADKVSPHDWVLSQYVYLEQLQSRDSDAIVIRAWGAVDAF